MIFSFKISIISSNFTETSSEHYQSPLVLKDSHVITKLWSFSFPSAQNFCMKCCCVKPDSQYDASTISITSVMNISGKISIFPDQTLLSTFKNVTMWLVGHDWLIGCDWICKYTSMCCEHRCEHLEFILCCCFMNPHRWMLKQPERILAFCFVITVMYSTCTCS